MDCWTFPFGWVILIFVVVLGFQPISGDDLWWELSKGRTVVNGSFAPSRDLLAHETSLEADWLGGLPVFLAYALLGASGLMLVRLAASLALLWVICCGSRRLHSALMILLPTSGLLAAQQALNPGPLMFDTIGVAAVFLLAQRWRTERTAGHAAALLLILALWANLAPRVILGLVVLAAAWLDPRNARQQRGSAGRWWTMPLVLVAALVACSLTPRGMATLWDSLRTAFPRLAADAAVLQQTAWCPLWIAPWGVSEWVFVTLSVAALALMLVRSTWSHLSCVLALLLIQLLVWSSAANLAPAAVWLALLVAGILSDDSQPKHAVVPKLPRWMPVVFSRRWALALLAVLGVVGLLAMRVPQRIVARMGWGIDTRLDNRLVRLALESAEPHGTAMCDDLRSVGILCWAAPAGVVAQDAPRRALLGGRLREDRLILEDLKHERRASHWREDGSRGGWWLALQDRQTTLLVISSEDDAMIGALEPTIWRPLSLDSPVIPFAAAGDPKYAGRVIEVVQQQELVSVGPWSYSPPKSTGSPFDRDRWGWRPITGDSGTALQQARVFRAMKLQIAALRVLGHALASAPSQALRAEFARCQTELARDEWLAAGQASAFRRLALLATLTRTNQLLTWNAKAIGPPPDLADNDRFPADLQRAIAVYIDGRLDLAIQELSSDTSESIYASACLLLEQGNPERAVAALRRIEQQRGNRADAAVLLLARRLAQRVEEGTKGKVEESKG